MSAMDNAAAAPRNTGLLAVVIGLGFLIALALGALIGGAIMKGRAAPAAETQTLDLEGGQIAEVISGPAAVVVRVRGGAGEVLHLYSAETGARIGEIRAASQP